jgi:hypothetical protein
MARYNILLKGLVFKKKTAENGKKPQKKPTDPVVHNAVSAGHADASAEERQIS